MLVQNSRTMVYWIVCNLLSFVYLCGAWTDNTVRRFPNGFKFGVATAAYQVEGGWNDDGRGESIWDHYIHKNPEVITDASTGDIAADSYHLFERDVEMLRELGVDFYRFSISWPRVLPSGFNNDINEAGFKYYDNLIDELIKYNIEPMVTMYHFDLPQRFQELGGWMNPLSIEWFQDYARTLFNRYGHKVQHWITFNQPNTICLDGYGDGNMAPWIRIPGIAEYICIKNVLLANAAAWRMYNEEYRSKYGGSVGISVAVNWLEPFNNATENVEATENLREFTIGLYMDPIFSKYGDFPPIVKSIVSRNSKELGFPRSRLPQLTSEEIKTIRGSADFLAMNHYTTNLVKRPKKNQHVAPSFDHDTNVVLSSRKEWKKGKSPWLRSVPYGLYKACLYLNKKYDYPKIFITENGWSTGLGLHDEGRVQNLREYLKALLLALEDGTDVQGFTVWSLMDNFEWNAGYTERFGLYEVDFESKTKDRKARKSALVYKEIISSRLVDMGWEPGSLNITVSDRRLKMKAKVEL